MHRRCRIPVRMAALLLLPLLLPSLSAAAPADETGLITKPSRYSVRDTIDRFEAAVRAKGWMVFTEIDHAAAAAKYGLKLRPRTVVIFGSPKVGTPLMQKAPTLAIDVPLKALVWQDDDGKVWLTYNSAAYMTTYIYPRHGVGIPAEMRGGAQALDQVGNEATQ